MTVDFATEDDTALAGEDYGTTGSSVPVEGTASLQPGATSITIQIPVIDDAVAETVESFTVSLSNPTGGAIVSPDAGSAKVAIVDDDAPSIAALPLATGLNLIGVPVQLATTTRAADVAQQIADQGGQVAQVVRWAEGKQGFVLWSAASPAANNFDLEVGRGYFVLLVSPPPTGVWYPTGWAVIQSVPIGLVAGLNLVSVPFETPAQGYDTVSLAQAVQGQGGQVAQIIRWDPGRQVFDLWSAASPAANVFAVNSMSGYFLPVIQPTGAPFEP